MCHHLVTQPSHRNGSPKYNVCNPAIYTSPMACKLQPVESTMRSLSASPAGIAESATAESDHGFKEILLHLATP